MRSLQPRPSSPVSLRRQIERLSGLPLRPSSVRFVAELAARGRGRTLLEPEDTPKSQLVTEIDPGLGARARVRTGAVFDALGLIAERPWWTELGGAAGEALGRHWRHAVAVSQAARRLARECGDPEPEQVARAGLLHGLGRWAVAAVDPQWLADWLAEADPKRRLELERSTLGYRGRQPGTRPGRALGLRPPGRRCRLAPRRPQADPERLRLRPESAGPDPGGVRMGRADTLGTGGGRRPRSPTPSIPGCACSSPRCRSAADRRSSSPTPPRTRRSWRARTPGSGGKLRQLRAVQQSRDRFLAALAGSEPTESPETWAERAGLCWCGEPGVTAARVVWTGPNPGLAAASAADAAAPSLPPTEPDARDERPASVDRPARGPGRPCAEVHLWTLPGSGLGADGLVRDPAVRGVAGLGGPGGRAGPARGTSRAGHPRPSRPGRHARSRGSARRSSMPWPSSPPGRATS